MLRPGTLHHRDNFFSIVFSLVASTAGGGILLPPAFAQPQAPTVEEGYITALRGAGGFDINRTHVVISSRTSYGMIGEGIVTSMPLRERLQIGANVQVTGTRAMQLGAVVADEVLLSATWMRKYAGAGAIEKVIPTGSETVLQADGYRIRISSKTKVDFADDFKSMADVSPNAWVRYDGKLDDEGFLVAAHARFFSSRSADEKAALDEEAGHLNLDAPNLDAGRDGGVKIGLGGGRHAIPADKKLQERIARVGMSVIPAWQKAMADGNPAKIPFRFYAIDDDRLHTGHFAYRGGLILVPRPIVERLASDDQLAAVLADGVAYTLEQQGLKSKDHPLRISKGEVIADATMMAISPLGGAAGAYSKIETEWEQQRGRVALSLMADAGYDPWQAPEAWKMLGPKHLPKDTASLEYPDRAGYQLSILNLQYRKRAGEPGTGAKTSAFGSVR